MEPSTQLAATDNPAASEISSTAQPSLTSVIDSLETLPLSDAVSLATSILPDLAHPHISPTTGLRIVTHPAYAGEDDLNRFGRVYLRIVSRCRRERASLVTRLQCYDTYEYFRPLFDESNEMVKSAPKEVREKLIEAERGDGGCGCCNGDPVWAFGQKDDVGDRVDTAVMFEESEYNSIFGESTRSFHGQTGWVNGKSVHSKAATRDAMVEAIKREERGESLVEEITEKGDVEGEAEEAKTDVTTASKL